MISRSVFLKLWAQSKTPAQFFQARMSRPLMAAVVAAGLLLSGSGKLPAQDVPPPPPDASQQDQQQAPQDNQQLPQYGAPLPQDQNTAPNSYPQQQHQGYPQQQQAPAPQGQPLTADQLNQLVAPIALYPDALVAQVLAARRIRRRLWKPIAGCSRRATLRLTRLRRARMRSSGIPA